MQEILIESIRTDETQSRKTLDKTHVADLLEQIQGGK